MVTRRQFIQASSVASLYLYLVYELYACMPLGVCINRAQMHAKQVMAMQGHTNACTRNPRSINDGCGHVITRGLFLYQHRTRLHECLMSLYVR